MWSFSLPAKETCPGATEYCRVKCYAAKAHFLNPTVQARYTAGEADSRRNDFAARAAAEIVANGVRTVRLHASGDFYDAEYAAKWLAICRRTKRTRYFGYTRSWRDPAILPVLKKLAALPNVSLWWSEDRFTGPSPKVKGVRVAFMAASDEDLAAVDPKRHDMVFRDTSLRTTKRDGMNAVKWASGVLVCPAEQWPVWRHQLEGKYDRPPSMTCARCRLCIEPDAIPRPPETRRRSAPEHADGHG